MKSKLNKNQIIKKVIAIFILLALIFTSIATMQVSFADSYIVDKDYLMTEENEHLLGAIEKNIEDLKKQVEEMQTDGYKSFVSKIEQNKNSKIVEISNEVELRSLAIYVASTHDCNGYTFRLTNNITLNKTVEWTPIGGPDNQFKGTLDGAGYTISGILISIKQNYAGLIGYLGVNGCVKNLTITNSNINIPPEVDNQLENDLVAADEVGYSYLGAFVGYAEEATIFNCHNKTNVNGGNIVGGIVGRISGADGAHSSLPLIKYCSNTGIVKSYRTAGGIAGSMYATWDDEGTIIDHCFNKGTINAITSNAGGICGTLWNNSKIEKCENDGDVSVFENKITVYVFGKQEEFICRNAGGIVGWTGSDEHGSSTKITNCINRKSATIKGYQVVGGIVGRLGGQGVSSDDISKILVENCYDYSKKISQYNKDNAYVGYIVGYIGCGANTKGGLKECGYYFDENNCSSDKTEYEDAKAKNKEEIKEIGGYNDNTFKVVDDATKQEEKIIKKPLTEEEYIDNQQPSFIHKQISNNGNSQSFAVKGDTLTITLFFNEPINFYRILPTISNNTTFIGISEDGKKLVFEYEVQGNETEDTSLNLYGNVYDTFGNLTNLSNIEINLNLNDYITIINNNSTNQSLTKNQVAYTISGFKVGTDGNLYFNNNDNKTITVTAKFNGPVTHDVLLEEDPPKLHLKINEKDIEITGSKSDDITYNYSYVIPEEDKYVKVKLTDVWVQTIGTVTIGDTYYGQLTQDNTGVTFTNIYVDTISPELTLSASVNNVNEPNKYTMGEDILITATAIDNGSGIDSSNAESAPEINVSFSESGLGKYNYQSSEEKGNAKFIQKIIKNGTVTYQYRYTIQQGDEGTIKLQNVKYINIKDIAGNTKEYPSKTLNSEGSIIADTTAPTVELTPMISGGAYEIKNGITNENSIVYKFSWSEDIVGFNKDDITVNNGTKKEFGQNRDGTYYLYIEPSVKNGNVGELQVIVEQDAVQDLVGYGNIRAESVIKIDKQAPILYLLQAYVDSPKYSLSDTINDVKEEYTIGDIITIEAIFNENINKMDENTPIPTLTLQFSDSGVAKGNVSAGTIEGNKIIYTYEIQDGDAGTLSVKAFSGKVKDIARNVTTVAKKALDGDTIIANISTPELRGITVIAPDFKYDELIQDPGDTKRYGVGTTIKVIAEFNENIYYLSGTEIKKITETEAPTLNLKFGTGEVRTGIFSEIQGNKIYYTYKIVSTDNGDLNNLSINIKSNTPICDIAGNRLTGNYGTSNGILTKMYEDIISEENKVDKITADTTKPRIGFSVDTQNKDDNGNTITGIGDYCRKGSSIIIKGCSVGEYVYKKDENNNLCKFDTGNAPLLKIKFDEEGEGEATCKEVAYDTTTNQTVFIYQYTIKENNNGRMSVNIDEKSLYDIALNENGDSFPPSKSVIADTIRPYYPDQPGIVYSANAYTVTFNEALYYLEDNQVKSFGDLAKAPKLKFENSDVEYTATSVNGNVITYNTGNYINAKPYLSNSTMCDKAGNLYAYYDQQGPQISTIKIKQPANKSGTYQAGTEVEILATFSEKITGTAPVLTIKFGDGENRIISAGIIDENTITYKYTIQDGDNGKLTIVSFEGTDLKDLSDNQWKQPETTPTLEGYTITADTTKPTVTIKAYKNYKTSDKKEVSGKTNSEVITYEFTWNEIVKGFDIDDINVMNGIKDTFTEVTERKVYTLDVINSNEGVQTVTVPSGVCTDTAKIGYYNSEQEYVEESRGNPNESGRMDVTDAIEIDRTAPTVRARINGGMYVIDTDTKESKLNEKLVINEKLSEFKYIWSTSETIPDTDQEWQIINPSNIEINSDIPLATSVDATGTYYLYMKVTDQAGNIFTGRTKAFNVKDSAITLTPDITEQTKQDVTVKVTYGEGLTENRRAGVQGKTQSADASTVIVSENGTVYAEATDIAGNKVYNTLKVTNINKSETDTPPTEEDKTAPEITFNYTTTTANAGTTIGATITTNEDAIIEYSWDNQDWISSEDYVRSVIAKRTPTTANTYTLYAKATDKSGNVSEVATLTFTVVESGEEIVNPEIVFEDLTTVQKNGVKYVKVSPTYTTEQLTSKMNQDALAGSIPQYTKLTSDNQLRTGSEITINGETKYIIIVNGDVDCDGEVTFLGDIIMINNYRIGVNRNLRDIQILAGDINNSGTIEFIPDIVAMNNYRLGNIVF